MIAGRKSYITAATVSQRKNLFLFFSNFTTRRSAPVEVAVEIEVAMLDRVQ